VVKDPARRLGTAAQVVERIETLDARVAQEEAEEARVHAEREAAAARERAEHEAAAARERARRIRGLRWALAGAVSMLVLVAGLGVYAARQRRAAEDNARRAEASAREWIEQKNAADAARGVAVANAAAARQQSQLALETLSAVIFDIQRSLENVPAASEVRRRLLTTALGRLEKLSGAFVEKASVDRHTAVSLAEMGDLVLQFGEAARPSTPDVSSGPDAGTSPGAVEVARRLQERANAIFQALAKADPNNAQAQRDLSISYNKLGDVQLQLGATDKALGMYQKGLDVRLTLAKADLNNAQAQRDLSISYSKLGNVQSQLGATDKALEMYQKDLDVSLTLAKADPNNAQAQRDLSFSYRKLGEAYQKAGDLAQARTHFERALELDSKRTLRLPRDAMARRDLGLDCEWLATLSVEAKDWARGADFAGRAIEHAHAAHRLEGDDVRDRWNYSFDLHLLGVAQVGAGRLKDARQSLEAAIEANPKWALSHNELAWLLATAWDASIRDGQRAVALATKACELLEWKDWAYLDTLAAAYAEAGQFADALKWETKALETPDALGDALEEARARLKLYQAGQPYHEPKPPPEAGTANHD
jgi:tetratricopeptide (TPR) repeat protein